MRENSMKNLPGVSYAVVMLLAVALWPSVPALGQDALPTRDQAMKRVGVIAISGWQEFIPAEGRLRILFPGRPKLVDDVRSVHDYRIKLDDTEWRALYSDLDAPMKDEAELRTTLDRASNAMVRPGTTIRSRTEIRINAQLGLDMILEVPQGTLFLRAVQAGQRSYIVSALRAPGRNTCTSYPVDVQQFFDTFTFWQ